MVNGVDPLFRMSIFDFTLVRLSLQKRVDSLYIYTYKYVCAHAHVYSYTHASMRTRTHLRIHTDFYALRSYVCIIVYEGI